MRPVKPLIIVAFLLAASSLAAGAVPPSRAGPAPNPPVPEPCTLYPEPCTLYPEPCTLYPEPCSSGRGILQDFDLLTEKTQVEANVSDPEAVSVSLVVVVRNNGTLPLSVTLSASINLGGTVALAPARTPMLIYGGTSNSVVSVTLPENSSSESIGYLQISGACNENPAVTQSLQVRLAIKQWHRVKIDRFTLDPGSPLEGQLVQLGAHILNAGNGPSNFSATVLLDGKPLELRINGQLAGGNTTVQLGQGKFFTLGASWKAKPGRHDIVLRVADAGAGDSAGGSGPLGADTRSASFTVGYNFTDLIPYAYATIFLVAVAAVAGYRYRRQLVPRLRRLKRMLKRGEPGSEGDEGYGDEGDDDFEDYGEEPPRARMAVAAKPRRPAGRARRRTVTGRPAGKAPEKADRAPASHPAGPGVIVVGGPEEGPAPPRKPKAGTIRTGEEE